MGTVSKVTAQSVTVTTAAKKNVDVGLNAKTTYTRGDKTVTAADMKVGDRVVIDATEVNEALTAPQHKAGSREAAQKRSAIIGLGGLPNRTAQPEPLALLKQEARFAPRTEKLHPTLPPKRGHRKRPHMNPRSHAKP